MPLLSFSLFIVIGPPRRWGGRRQRGGSEARAATADLFRGENLIFHSSQSIACWSRVSSRRQVWCCVCLRTRRLAPEKTPAWLKPGVVAIYVGFGKCMSSRFIGHAKHALCLRTRTKPKLQNKHTRTDCFRGNFRFCRHICTHQK